jgi:hypothetical protein
MANLEKRGNYSPRQAREQRAYRLVVAGGVSGAVGVVSALLAIFGAIGWTLPILALIVAAVCITMFRAMVRPR